MPITFGATHYLSGNCATTSSNTCRSSVMLRMHWLCCIERQGAAAGHTAIRSQKHARAQCKSEHWCKSSLHAVVPDARVGCCPAHLLTLSSLYVWADGEPRTERLLVAK
jgi:hypothetical protein